VHIVEIKMKKFYCLLLLTNFFYTQLTLASWPRFLAPDFDFLLKENYIDMASCPFGKGRMLNNIRIPINKLCTTFCPDNWYYLVHSDEQCLTLYAIEFNFQNYNISHFHDNQGNTIYTKIEAYYGKTPNAPAFTMTFTTPKDYWYCYESQPATHTISCANDI
jgi:hypothetical protein